MFLYHIVFVSSDTLSLVLHSRMHASLVGQANSELYLSLCPFYKATDAQLSRVGSMASSEPVVSFQAGDLHTVILAELDRLRIRIPLQ